MARVWYAIAAVLLIAGVAGTVLLVQRFPEDPRLVEVRFPGSYEATGTIAITHAGPYAIWADGGPPVDGDRCVVHTPSAQDVTVTAPKRRADWTNRAEDDAVYTWIASFDAPTDGPYTIRCRPDPNAPGAAYLVSERPK